jgi:type IV pilus assembly protein PilM
VLVRLPGNNKRMILLRGFALGSLRVIGLDVGTTAVKAARMRCTRGHFAVVGLAQATIDGEPSAPNRQDNIAAAIRHCLQELGGKDGVVCGISGPDVAVRTFDLPALPRKQLTSAVELEAAQVCPFDIQEGVVAFQVLRGAFPETQGRSRSKAQNKSDDKVDRMSGILAAAKKDVVGRLRELCTRSQAHCTMVDVDGLALLNCLQACQARQGGQTALVLNVGSTYTNLAILSDDDLPFVLDIAYAGQEIVNQLCQNTGADRKTVTAFLERTEEQKSPEPEALISGLARACTPLAERVKETARYHAARKPGLEMNKVLVCGGLAQAQPVVKVLGSLLERQVELWDPLASLSCARALRKGELVKHGPQFAVALGLAMRSARDVQD